LKKVLLHIFVACLLVVLMSMGTIVGAEEENCAHSYRSPYAKYFDAVYTELDAFTHVVSGHLSTGEMCIECGEILTETVEEEISSRLERHSTSNWVCVRCGVEITCPHPQPEDYDPYYLEASYEAVDEKEHVLSGYRVERSYCPICQHWWYYNSDVENEISAVNEAHIFEYGVCWGCGFENTCDHPQVAQKEFYSSESYAPLDEENHQRFGLPATYMECEVCGDVWDIQYMSEFVTQIEAHEVEDGVCRKCGDMPSCAHENITNESLYMNEEYTAQDEKYHLFTSYQLEYSMCQDCGEWVESTLADEPYSKKERHYFEDGVCYYCDMENTCKHGNVSSGSYYDSVISYTYKDEQNHTAEGYQVHYQECQDCGEMLEEEVSSELTTAVWSHSYENGVCRDCGYENICAHEQTYEGSYLTDAEYAYVDEKSHNSTGYEVRYVACEICYEHLEEQTSSEPVTRLEKHHFAHGECSDCGYVNTCKHLQAEYHEFLTEQTYSDITATTHTATGYVISYTYCYDCNEQMNYVESDEQKSEVSKHWWNDEGVCECGYKNTCSHPQTESYDYLTNTTYVYKDENSHLVTGYTYTQYHCKKCNEWWESEPSKESVTEEENHYYRNGVCTDCKAENTCPHNDLNVHTEFVNPAYTALNSLGHLKVGVASSEYYCYDCRDSWTVESEEMTVMEAHEFQNYYNTYYYGIYLGEPTCDHCGYYGDPTLLNEIREKYTYEESAEVVAAIEKLTQGFELMEGGLEQNFRRYGYLPGDDAASMLKNFSIVRPVVTAQEAEIKIYDLAAAAEWDIVNQYNFQMEGQPEVQSIDLAQLSALFGDAWQDTKSISCAMGYTVDANGTFYSWVPVYYEDAQGQIYQDALYLYVDVVYPGQDKEYIQGKIYYAFDDGFHTESYIIADPVRVSQFLKMVVDEAALTAGQEDANSYYYDLKLDSSGSNVKKIQAALVEKGYLSSSVDGYFGPVTEAAVKAYQKDMGLKETGVADENLQRMLLSDANEKQLLAQWLQKHQ